MKIKIGDEVLIRRAYGMEFGVFEEIVVTVEDISKKGIYYQGMGPHYQLARWEDVLTENSYSKEEALKELRGR